jgi:tetratricopeptide (TPR) repeat protein
MQETGLLVLYKPGVWLNECMDECIQSINHSFNQFFSPLLNYRFLLAITFFCVNFSFTSAQVYPDPKVDSLLTSGIRNIINQNYDLAKKDFVILDKKFPEIPLGKIYLAAAEIAKSSDLATPFNSKFIEQKLEEAKEISENLIDKDEYNIWNYYSLALANGYDAYFKALTGEWLSAFGEGLTSVNLFEHCLEIYPEFYESLIAIGTYKYWKSKETQFIGWIPFVNDEREEGIKLLEKAVDQSSYNSYLAINSLIWIYIDKGESGKAVKLAQSTLRRYPDCRFFRFGLARGYEDIDLKKSIDEYYKILNSFSKNEKPNRYNEILLKHLIAQQYNKLGESEESLRLCNEILSIKNLTEYEKQKLGERLERVKKLQKELQ